MKINHYYLKALDNMLRASAKPEDFSLLQEGSSEANSFIFPIEDEILKKDNLFRKHATVLNCFKNGGTIVATVSILKLQSFLKMEIIQNRMMNLVKQDSVHIRLDHLLKSRLGLSIIETLM
jgi:hypothetical protein